MSPLVVVIAASAGILVALLLLAVMCACVLASRADDALDHLYAGSDPFDDVSFDWPVGRARVIEFPGRTAFPMDDAA